MEKEGYQVSPIVFIDPSVIGGQEVFELKSRHVCFKRCLETNSILSQISVDCQY